MTGRKAGATSFLNVDLDIEGPDNLDALVATLGESVFELHTGPAPSGYQAHLELSGRFIQPGNAEAAIDRFVALLRALPPKVKRLWKRATRRDLNIGIQAGTTPRAFETALGPETLAAAADLGARIVTTVYAAELPTKTRRKPRRRQVSG